MMILLKFQMLSADWSAPLGFLEGIEAVGCILEPAGHTARHVSSD